MGIACKASCVAVGVSLSCGFAALMIAGIVEKKKFDPFYRNAECPEVPLAIPMMRFSLPPMLAPNAPPMSPPYGLFGSILNTTSSCHNPNQLKIITKKTDFTSTLYVPVMSNWTWGVSEKQIDSGKVGNSYIKVASGHLKQDYILPAGGTGTAQFEYTANTSIEPFLPLFQTISLSGYSPLYTKTVSRPESCIKLFGLEFCGKKDTETVTWCGVLAGTCQSPVHFGGMKVWAGALCAYTQTICRLGGEKGEAEMKSLVTAGRLGLSTIELPCTAQSGLPPSMTCPIAQAPGINATLHQVPIPALVDGPIPEQKDIDDGESTIALVTTLVILVGALGCLVFACLTGVVARRWIVSARASNPSGASSLPSILSSGPVSKKQSGSVQGSSV